MSTGYNWRNTLTHFASISGVLAGFCVTFIALILGGKVADIKIFTSGITFGQVATLFFGISTGLFICAAELFLYAKEFDVFGIPEPYRKLLKDDCKLEKKEWAEFEDEQTERCRQNERLGRRCYNSAIFIVFGGLFFAIAPYNLLIAFLVSIIGIALELFQLKNELVSKLSSVRVMIKVIMLISLVLTAFFIGFCFGHFRGRNDVISKIAHHEDVSLELSSSEILTQLKQDFPEKLNYTQLLVWESTKLNYTLKRRIYTNPIDIKNYGRGACGEFSILYVAVCLANNIPARLVTDLVVDHVWAEVNPLKDGKTWIHVEPTDSCVRIQKAEKSIYDTPATANNPSLYSQKNFQMVFAFQVTEERQVLIIDRTSFYKS